MKTNFTSVPNTGATDPIAIRSLVSASVAALLVTFATGCGGAQMLLKGPLTDKCTGAGLEGCPDLVDGVLAYVDGKKPEGEEKLKKAAAENSPDKVKSFAGTLEPLLELPGVSSYAKPIKEVVDLLADASKVKREPQKAPARLRLAAAGEAPATVPPPSPAPGDDTTPPEGGSAPAAAKSEPVRGASARASSLDYSRIRTRTITPATDAKAAACAGPGVTGHACTRVPVFIGPFVVTDLYAPGGCSDELFVYADNDDGRGWVVFAGAGGTLSLQGGQLVVPADEKLYVGVRNQKGTLRRDAPRCSVTFSGWKPE